MEAVRRFAAHLEADERDAVARLLLHRAPGVDAAVAARSREKGWLRRMLDRADRRASSA